MTANFGIIGLGMIAEMHARAIEELDDGCVAACYDISSERVADFSSRHGCTPYTELNAFLAHPGLEIVTICTPSGLHLDSALPAAAAGKHLIVEKPLEITVERCDRIIAAARENGVLLSGIFPSRFHAVSQVVKHAVNAGRFGNIVLADAYVKWYRTQAYYDSSGWKGTWALDGGGALMNQSIHAVDLLQWFVGPVSEVLSFTGTLAHERIEVEDTGIGISKENLKLIFDEFVQLENESGKKYSGTGLGLSIVKNLVELQDGSVSVSSEPGQGTCISVVIPYPSGNEDKIDAAGIKAPVIPDHFRYCSVLIADDEEFNRYVLKNIFNKWGVKYQEAVNGEEAIAKSLAINFDVILMDMRMPKKNGIEAAETILNVKPNSKIIAVTAADSNVERKYAMKAGMSGFLTKPFSENDLFNIVSPFMIANREEIHNRTSSELDTAELERLANGDINFLREMIRLYIKTSENGIIKIKEASSAEDWETVTETAHKLAAPSKHINAHSLYNKLKELELISQNGSDPSVINELCKLVEKKIKEVNYSLRDYLNSQGNE